MARTVESLIAGRKMPSIAPDATIDQAVAAMVQDKTGSLIVVENEKLVGLITKRDIIHKVLFSKLDPNATLVEGVMATKMKTVKKTDDTAHCMAMMSDLKFRELPVVGWWNKALGCVSMTEVLIDLIDDLEKQKKDFETQGNAKAAAQLEPYTKKNHLRDLVKGQTVLDMPPTESAMEAIQLMASCNVGCVLITEDGNLVGVFSEGDVINRLMGKKLKPNDTKMGDVMTKNCVTVDVSASVQECLSKMKTLGCRHLPVTENGKLVGVVSIVNCLNWMFDEFKHYVDQWQKMVLQYVNSSI